MRKLSPGRLAGVLLALLATLLLVAGSTAATRDDLELRVLAETSSTVTLGWDPQPGFGYLFSADGKLVSRTNDQSRSTVKFSKQYASFEVAVVAKGATGTYPPPAPPPPPPPKAACGNGLDDDADGKIDYPADPGCSSATDTDETDPVTPPPSGCAVSTPNVPDGPDPWGGCFPGPSNTGPDAPQSSMQPYTGSCVIRTANQVIDSKVISCDIRIDAGVNGLVIKNSYLVGGASVSQVSGSPSFTVQDSYVEGTRSDGFSCVECGISGSNITVLRTQVNSTNRAIYCASNCTIRDNYLHTAANLNPARGDHASGMRLEQNGTVTHNTIGCRYTGPFSGPNVNPDVGCSADISGYPDFVPIHHNTLENNLFLANAYNAYCVYAGGTRSKPYSNDPQNATYIVVRNNVWQRGTTGICAAYGPVTDFVSGRTGNVWSGNVYDNGSVVNPG